MRPRTEDGFFLRWKWVFLYTVFLLGSVALVPYLVSWLYRRDWIDPLKYGPGFLIAGGLVWLGVRFFRSGPERRIRWLGVFLAACIGYGFFLFRLSTYPVERFHLLEYGMLAFLWMRALDDRSGWARRAFYAVAGVLFVGFVDEVFQGVLPRRYYENRDILLNVSSGIFGLIFYYLYRGFRGEPRPSAGPRQTGGSVFWRRDLAGLAVMAAVTAGMLYLESLPTDPEDLFGYWARPGRCGGVEMMRLTSPDRYAWWDDRGNRSRGRFRLAGNRLESVILEFVIEADENQGRCGIRRKGNKDTVSTPIRLTGDVLIFEKREKYPWRRRPAP